MFLIKRNWLKVEQSDKLTRRRLSSEFSKSSVTTRSLISQKNDILLPSALLPPNSKVSLEQVAHLKLDCCKAHLQAFKVKTLIFATINCSHQVNGKAGLWRVVSEWLDRLSSTGWHPNAEPNAFWAQWTVLGWWGSLVLVLRGLGVVVC